MAERTIWERVQAHKQFDACTCSLRDGMTVEDFRGLALDRCDTVDKRRWNCAVATAYLNYCIRAGKRTEEEIDAVH